MDTLNGIMERLKAMTGTAVPVEPMTDEEYTKFKCESYNNNSGNLNEKDGYNCDKCKNKGYIAEIRFQNNDWYEVHCECKCMKTRRTISRLMKSGLKNIIKDYTFARYETPETWQQLIKEKAVEYTKNPEKAWFFIGGQSGCGKTHICTAIAGQFLKAEKNVRYMLWRDDVNKIKSNITEADKYSELMNTYKNAEVLYIDDLFKNGKGADGKVQPPTASDIQTAFEILNYRANNKHLITIISSERNILDLIEIDEATGGRIAEMAFEKGFGFNINPDKSKNYRLKGITSI
jgi:DNA replication protein DnaC